MDNFKLKSGAVYGVSTYDAKPLYIVRVRIGQVERDYDMRVELKSLYRFACSLARRGKRDHVKVRVLIRDWHGNTLVRVYGRYSEISGKWIARHSSACRYSGYQGKGRDL